MRASARPEDFLHLVDTRAHGFRPCVRGFQLHCRPPSPVFRLAALSPPRLHMHLSTPNRWRELRGADRRGSWQMADADCRARTLVIHGELDENDSPRRRPQLGAGPQELPIVVIPGRRPLSFTAVWAAKAPDKCTYSRMHHN
jgi:hypothetical protein